MRGEAVKQERRWKKQHAKCSELVETCSVGEKRLLRRKTIELQLPDYDMVAREEFTEDYATKHGLITSLGSLTAVTEK